MKVAGWIGNQLSERLALAVVTVEPGETADVEAMLRLLDGDSVGHFGISVELVGSGDFDVGAFVAAERQQYLGRRRARGERQFGYPNATALGNQPRHYLVHVNRD